MKVAAIVTKGKFGAAVLRSLTARGHRVAAIARSGEEAVWAESCGASVARGDVFSLASLEEGIDGAEAILNAAHAAPRKLLFDERDWLPNDRLLREGVENVVTAALRRRTPLLVQLSSVLAYGDHDGAWVDEEIPLRPPSVLRAVADMEDALRVAEKVKGLRAVILRGGILCGSRLWYLDELLARLADGGLSTPSSGGAYLNLIHPEDLALAAVLAVEKAPAGRTINVTDGEPIQLRALMAEAAATLGLRPPRSLPEFLFRFVLPRPVREILTASARVAPRVAREVLGFAPAHAPARARIPDMVRAWAEARARGEALAPEDP
ncbi:MAG: NAD(P)H-binding protein [Planctomycetes bacterium]|nr:NAD(P)H-binding protein [Planctomycetota bacterium]